MHDIGMLLQLRSITMAMRYCDLRRERNDLPSVALWWSDAPELCRLRSRNTGMVMLAERRLVCVPHLMEKLVEIVMDRQPVARE
jgi:hypothetical protein